MKKKLFLTLAIVMVLTCLFAIGVSAEVTTYDDAPTRTNIVTSTDDVIVFDDGFTCPSAYVVNDSTSFGWKQNAYSFGYINGKTGKNYGYDNIVELDIPQGVTSITGGAFASNNVIRRVSCPNTVTSIGGTIFEYSTSLQEFTFEHDENDGLETIPNWMFAYCTALKAICFPDCVKYFKGNTQLGGCTNLTAIYLPKNLISTEGGQNAGGTFGHLTNAYFVNEKFTYDNIPTKPEVYYFPAGYKSITGEAFDTSKNLNKVLVFPADGVTFENGWTFENSLSDQATGAKPTIVFTGDVTKVSVGSWNVEKIYFANKNDVDTTTAGVTGSKSMVFCNAAGNTTHLYLVEKNTAPTCTEPGVNGTACFCGKPNPDSPSIPAQHDYNKTLSYNAWAWENDNYFANAHYVHVCQVCAEEYAGAEIENSYLFIKEGFATFANKDGETIKSYDFQYSIKVNTDAMDNYTVATGKVIKYGTVAGVGNSLTNPISYENGTLSVGASAAVSDMTGTDYVKLLIKVTSIPVLEEGVEITCNAYAIVDDKLRYVGETTVTENAQFSVIK